MKVNTVKLPAASAKGGSSPVGPADGKAAGENSAQNLTNLAPQAEAPAFIKLGVMKPAPARPASASVTSRIIEGRAEAAKREPQKPEAVRGEAAATAGKPADHEAGETTITQILRDPRAIALAGGLGAVAIGAGARFGFSASLLESVFWSASFAGLGLGAASFVRMTGELKTMRRALDHTRKHMATTARVLSETLEQAETLNALSREAPVKAVPAKASLAEEPVPSASHAVHLEGLVNVARAQVILAHKSEADMNVLSTLVSNLAEAVGEQEKELQALRGENASARSETAAARKEARETAELVRQLASRQGAGLGLSQRDAASLDLRLSKADSSLGRGSAAEAETPEIAADPVLVRQLTQAFADRSYGFALQPVVTLPQRKVKFYEMSVALGTGSAQAPAMLGAAAREANIAARYDRLLVSRALRMIRYFRSKQRDITILCEVTGAMLAANPAFDELISELRRDREAARSLVIAFPQKAYTGFRQAETDLLRFFTELGIRFGVMRLHDMKLDPAQLARDNVRVVGVDVGRIIAAIPTGMSGLDVHVADLAGLFARRDIDFVVQNLETEQELLDIMDFDVPLAQGLLLGEPRPVNPDLIEAAGEAEPGPAPLAPAPSPERQPLRNFLRRA